MARYDRIAPLEPPTRDRVFAGWLVLRDLEGRERDLERGRRARLRFLALRPVRRLARYGLERVPELSFERQVEAVREELGQLPARDAERGRLAQFLQRIRQRTPLAVTTATLDLGQGLEEEGQIHGAEEYYLTAHELAEVYALVPEQVIALRLLGRVYQRQERWEETERAYTRAAGLALRLEDRRQWGRAIEGLGRALRHQGKVAEAVQLFEEALERGRGWEDPEVIGRALAGLCTAEQAAGQEERAVEHGWEALSRLSDAEDRHATLSGLGAALGGFGLYRAAERCHALVATHSTRPAARAQAWLDLALLGLAQGQAERARDHLRSAVAAAQQGGFRDILGRAEELLRALERAPAGGKPPGPSPRSPGETVRRIATEIETFGERLVPA